MFLAFPIDALLQSINVRFITCWLSKQVWNVFRMEWEQFHNTGEWRTVKDVSVELSAPMLLSPKHSSVALQVGSGYRRLLLYLWLSHAISAAKEAMRWLMMGPVEKRTHIDEDTFISISPNRIKADKDYSLSPKDRNLVSFSPFQPKLHSYGLYLGARFDEEDQEAQIPSMTTRVNNDTHLDALNAKTRADPRLFELFSPGVSTPLAPSRRSKTWPSATAQISTPIALSPASRWMTRAPLRITTTQQEESDPLPLPRVPPPRFLFPPDHIKP
jgi:hypothetical protein